MSLLFSILLLLDLISFNYVGIYLIFYFDQFFYFVLKENMVILKLLKPICTIVFFVWCKAVAQK